MLINEEFYLRLDCAIRENKVNLLKSLLQQEGIDLNHVVYEKTPLMRAAGFGRSEIIVAILQRAEELGIREEILNKTTYCDHTALYRAAFEGKTDAVITLANEPGININAIATHGGKLTMTFFGPRDIPETQHSPLGALIKSLHGRVIDTGCQVIYVDNDTLLAKLNPLVPKYSAAVMALLEHGAELHHKDVDTNMFSCLDEAINNLNHRQNKEPKVEQKNQFAGIINQFKDIKEKLEITAQEPGHFQYKFDVALPPQRPFHLEV